MIPGVSGGQGNSVQGGDAGPATSGNAATGSQYGGAINFNFDAPGGFLGGTTRTGKTVIVVAGLALAAVVAVVYLKGRK